MTSSENARADRAVIERLADAARAAILPYFREERLSAENKATSGFDPVTAADRAAEAAIRAILDAERPEDGVLGEEYGEKPSANGRVWVLDPIDGTRAFLAGLLNWGVLIALVENGRTVLGALDQPYTRERFIGARQAGGASEASLRRDGVETRLRARPCAALADATVLTTDPRIFQNEAETRAFEAVAAAARTSRFGTDCYGYAMVAAGCADLVIESGLQAYDIQALIPIVDSAGGVVTDWSGGPDPWSGQVVAAGDRRVLDAALALLAPAAR